MKKMLFAIAAIAAGSVLFAAEITFTGGDSSNPTNLASAANWDGGALPGAGDVGVISSVTYPAVVVNSDVAFSGLKITGTAALTIGGASTLTLGAGGILRTGAGNLALRCPMATSAAQTWNIADGATIDIYSSITGTADLGITNFLQYAQHHATAGYDGQISYYKSGTSANNKWILYSAAGKWASMVRIMTGTPVYVRPTNNGTVNWSDIFPVNPPYLGSTSANLGLTMYNGASAKTVFKEGDSLTFGSGSKPYYLTVAGVFEQQGGTITKQDQYFLTLGHHAANPSCTYDMKCIYEMSGGNLNVGTVLIGYNAQDSNGGNVYFRQSGGTVKVPYSSAVGGGINVGGGISRHYTVAEYRMDGGTLDITSAYGNSCAFALAVPRANATTMPAAGFIMTDGTVKANWMTFGSDTVFWNGALAKITNGYGLLDLAGGDFQITRYQNNTKPDGWLVFSNSWNSDPADSNCAYSVKLHGGKIKMSDASQYAWPLLTCLPKSDVGTSIGYDNKDYLINAPLYGTGILKKDGTGTLLVKDAARFTGKVEVNGGTLEIDGGAGEDVDSDKCFRWLASSLAGLADNSRVEQWADVNFGVLASTNDNPKAKTKDSCQPGPTFKAAGFNSLPTVSFGGSQSITVPAADNPLWSRTNCTVVAVVKPGATTTRTTLGRYAPPIVSMMPGSGLGYVCFGGYGNDGGTAGWRPGIGRRWQGDGYTGEGSEAVFMSRSGVSCQDGDIHAIAYTLNGNRMTITADGDATNAVWTVDTKVAPFGCYNSSGYSAQKEATGRLFFGGHIVDNVDGAYFNGDILELRIYTNRLFTAAEQLKVTKHLLAEYGGDRRMMKYAKGPRTESAAGAFTRGYAAPTPVATAASWDADTIDAADGAAVTSWASENGEKTATTATAGGTAAAPTLVKNAINGHAALRFDRASKAALGIAADDSPITGSKNFTAAVVWRTSTAGEGASVAFASMTAAGLVSSKQSGTADDFALFYFNRSAVSAGYGCSEGNTDIMTRKPYKLDDGEVHISILACDGDGKAYRLMTDGCFTTGALAQNGSARGAFDTMIGLMRKNSSSAAHYFNGDIAAVKLYGTALTKGQMIDLGEHWAKKYATQLLVGYKYTPEHLRESGLGATNIAVAAGASLVVPLDSDSPFTMAKGEIGGAGEFWGTYRISGSAVLDFATARPAAFEELQFAGGVLKIDPNAAPPAVSKLGVAGENTIDVGAFDFKSISGKRKIMDVAESDVAADSTWHVVGAAGKVPLDACVKDGALYLTRQWGLTIRFR